MKLKNQIALLRALPLLDDKIEVIFLGDGTNKELCVKFCKDNNIANRVHFLGQVRNPYYYYTQCQFYISTSLSEGFPNALIEGYFSRLFSNCL